ncbi:hypothetical protein AB1Y20_013701 [Prymnesium parvum]|uniref:Glycoside hydrolase family 5 domain-containing protein n=1 Tax=Prymnesium parvum TaxID=97485 RepID=A0AB34II57_PRYPA
MPVHWAVGDESTPFSRPFELRAAEHEVSLRFEGDSQWLPLRLKGSNWAGFQTSGCVHELWHHDVQEYIDFLGRHRFNLVRLPLAADAVRAPSFRITSRHTCGALYENWETLSILDDVISRLRAAGVFVMLDIHTLDLAEHGVGAWCSQPPCSQADYSLFSQTWRTLAQRYCSFPNVIMADLLNEPHKLTWAQWSHFVQQIGAAVLHECPRWLIVAEGVGDEGGNRRRIDADPILPSEYDSMTQGSMWWGENILGYLDTPIHLPIPDRLVLSPHVYGHDHNKQYLVHESFPDNMPLVWDKHFGVVGKRTGVPIVIGEWGGVWEDTNLNGRVIPSTAEWQRALVRYLVEKSISSIYWTLNDNSFKTGSLFDGPHSREKLQNMKQVHQGSNFAHVVNVSYSHTCPYSCLLRSLSSFNTRSDKQDYRPLPHQ